MTYVCNACPRTGHICVFSIPPLSMSVKMKRVVPEGMEVIEEGHCSVMFTKGEV